MKLIWCTAVVLVLTACGTNVIPVLDIEAPRDVADTLDVVPVDQPAADLSFDAAPDIQDHDLADGINDLAGDVAAEVGPEVGPDVSDVVDVIDTAPDTFPVDAIDIHSDTDVLEPLDIIPDIPLADVSDTAVPFCPESRTCRIGDICYLEGGASPFDSCQVCATTGGVSAWVAAADGMICGAGRVCFGGVCSGPIITEFMVINNDTIVDEDGDSSDWIELYNPTGSALSLAGYRLTDSPSKPSRWTFPAVTLNPGQYLVVFASAKDRRDPAGELHTNFRLAGEGEYLALLSPDGRLIQSFQAFPPQVEDASYGINVQIDKTALIVAGDVAAIHVPSVASPAPDWMAPAFAAVEPDWMPGRTGVGFDQLLQYEVPMSGDNLGIPLADSVADWSSDGIQGENGWTYGYFDSTHDADHIYSADAFTPFPRSGSGWGPTNSWTGWRYEKDPPWVAVGPEYVQPSGQNSIASHWVIRRFQVTTTGPLFVQWYVAKTEVGGDGVTGFVFHNGVMKDAVSIGALDTAGTTRTLVLPNVMPGDLIDFAVSSTGPGGQSDDTSDGSVLTAALWQLAYLKREISTDVGDVMSGVSPTAYIRVGFDRGTAPLNRLLLRMKYDDGFTAWLDGNSIASANVPDAPAWDSVATRHRPVTAAVAWETYNISDHLGQMATGGNVLAVHGLNSAVDDPTFLVLPELEGRFVTYDTASERYYGIPTPGADNDDGAVGPILQHLTPLGAVDPGQDIVVSARVFFMEVGVASMTMWYRVMYGPEIPLPMIQGNDGIFRATIPAGAAVAGQMVRWFIQVTDTNGQTIRGPAFPDPLDSDQYFGTVIADPTVVSNLTVLQWFAENPAAAGTYAGTRASIFYADEFYDNVRYNIHGQSTQGFPKKSYNVDFNADHRFLLSPQYRRMKDINLLTNWADKSKLRNTLAYEVWRDSGAAYHLAFPMRIQLNGAFFSVADFVEDGDDRYLERLGLDPEGALYKMYDGLWTTAFGEKKTRKDEDKSDLQAFINALDQTGEPLRNYLYDNVNISAMVNFFAALTITATTDCCHKNFYAYRDTNGNGEWRYLPWDVDLTFGHNWIPSLNYFDDAMNPQNGLYVGWSKLTVALRSFPEFDEMFYRRLRTLMDQLQQPPGTPYEELKFEKRIDELVAQIGADAALDYAAWPKWGLDQTMEQAVDYMKTDFMAPRRVHLYETLTAIGGGPIPEAQMDPVIMFGDYDLSLEQPSEAWFTLVNQSDTAVDLSGWQLSGDISMTLQPGTVLRPGDTLYLSPDVVVFRARSAPPTGGQGLLVHGNYAGDLFSIGSLVLLDEGGVPVSWGL